MFDSTFDSLSQASGTPPDYVRLFLLFLVSYPLAVPLPYLSATQKHVANVVVTTFYLYGILGLKEGYAQLLANCLATYVITNANIGGKHNMPWIVFAFQMGHLTVNHLVRTFGNIPLTTIEITAMQMVLCMNLTSFAWSVHDGKNRSKDECDDQQKATRITEFPSLLEFLGYAFYFPGVLVGPSTRFNDYRAWASGDLYKTKNKMPPSGRFQAALIELLMGMAYMGVWTAFSPKYYYEALITPKGEPGSALHYGALGRILYVQAVGLAARPKYYGIWTLTNGACIMSGMSFNDHDVKSGKAKWNRCKNINVAGVEFANNWKELLDNWNMNTNVWLRNNVYKRVAKPGRKPGFKSTMATFITSAFWHGVAPGYYFTFVLGGLLQSVGRQLRTHLRPIAFKDVRTPNPSFSTVFRQYTFAQLLYCALGIAAVQATMNFAVAPFMLLEVGKSIEAWRNLSFYGLLAAIAPIVAFRLGAGKTLDKITGVKSTSKAKAAASQQHGGGGGAGATNGKANGKQADANAVNHANGFVANPQVPDVDVLENEAIQAGREAKQSIEKRTS